MIGEYHGFSKDIRFQRDQILRNPSFAPSTPIITPNNYAHHSRLQVLLDDDSGSQNLAGNWRGNFFGIYPAVNLGFLDLG